MAGRPKLPEDRKRVKVQTYLPPRLHKAACILAEQRAVSVSQVVADFALAGAKAYREAQAARSGESVTITSTPPRTPEDGTDEPDGP